VRAQECAHKAHVGGIEVAGGQLRTQGDVGMSGKPSACLPIHFNMALRIEGTVNTVASDRRVSLGSVRDCRFERGEVRPHSDTLKGIAEAHSWSMSEYLLKVAAVRNQRGHMRDGGVAEKSPSSY